MFKDIGIRHVSYGVGVQGLGIRVVGFRVWGLGFKV